MQGVAIVMLALALLYSAPVLTKKMALTPSSRELILSYATILATAAMFGVLPLFSSVGIADMLTALCLGYGMESPFYSYCGSHLLQASK